MIKERKDPSNKFKKALTWQQRVVPTRTCHCQPAKRKKKIVLLLEAAQATSVAEEDCSGEAAARS